MFVTCIVTVITGATALITVPVMIQFGMAPRNALAANMVILVLMSVGGVMPFIRGKEVDRRRAPLLIGLTLAGSVVGSSLVFLLPKDLLPLIIPIAMFAVLAFLLMNPRMGVRPHVPSSKTRTVFGYALIFFLAIYGGFFSGGYVTLLMAACVFFFGYTFLRSMVMARLINIASALMATCVFTWHGAVQWPLALTLGIAGFCGALIGAKWARRVPEKLLRAVFITAVALLAVKSLIFDVPWSRII